MPTKLLARQLACTLAPAIELGEQSADGLVRAQVEPRRLADRRRVETVGVAQHPRGERAHRGDRVLRVAQLGEPGSGAPRSFSRLLDDALRRVRRRARAAAPRRSRPRARARPENGERRNVNRSRRVPPSQAKRSSASSAWPNGVRASGSPPSIAYGMPSVPNAVSSGARPRSTLGHDDADALRRRAGAEQREELLADELERAARPRALEEADGAVERPRVAARVGEQRALEMGERRVRQPLLARRQLLDAPAGKARQILRRPTQTTRRPAGRARTKRDDHIRPAESASSSPHCAPVRSSNP